MYKRRPPTILRERKIKKENKNVKEIDRKRGDFIRVSLGTSAHKEGAWQWLESNKRNPEKTHKRKHRARKKKKTLQAQPSEEKERLYTVRLFRTNSLKEGAVWRAA
jgi:hypothetical protein